MTRPLLRLVITLAVTLLLAGVAYANDPATRAAKRHFDRGEKLFALGKFQDALDEYQKAYDAKPLPDFLFNIGQCQRNLGDFEAAIFSFKRYLKLAPDADPADREKVEEYIAELEAEQEKASSRKLKLVEEKPPPPPPEGKPVYKKWWFWSGVAAVGVGAVVIYAATRPSDPGGPPMTDGGNIELPPP